LNHESDLILKETVKQQSGLYKIATTWKTKTKH